MTAMSAISGYPAPTLAELPADIRQRMLEVQENPVSPPTCFSRSLTTGRISGPLILM
jgi:hypothetical protein